MTDISTLVFVAFAWSSIGFLVAFALGRILRYQNPSDRN